MDTRKIDFIFTGIAFLILILAVGCVPIQAEPPPTQPDSSPQASPTAMPAPDGETAEAASVASLVSALEASGAEVELAELVNQPFFPVEGQILKVDEQDIQVFVFPDEESRQQASALISEDGSSVGRSMIDWIDQPNFWATQNLIVLYVGQDSNLIDLLNEILGAPLTRHTSRPTEDRELPQAVQAARQRLSETTGVEAAAIEVVSFESVQWSDSCLGVVNPNIMCAMVITPGYRVILNADGQEYTLHTNQDGTNIVLPSMRP